MSNIITNFMETHTVIDCDLHGLVSARFGEATPEGMCKNSKYYIKYCCGLICTNKKPKTMLDMLTEEWNRKVMDKIMERKQYKSDSREILESWER